MSRPILEFFDLHWFLQALYWTGFVPKHYCAMKFTIKRKDLAGAESLELERATFSGRLSVRLGEQALERLKEKGHPYDLTMKDKTHRKLFVRARFLDPVPVVFIDNEEILLAEKLRWIDYLFGCFPALMFLVMGALPTVIAFFMLMANFRILRSHLRPSLKWAAIYALDMALFWAVYFIVQLVIRFAKS